MTTEDPTPDDRIGAEHPGDREGNVPVADDPMVYPVRSPSGQLILEAETQPERVPGWLRPLMTLDRWLGNVELGLLLFFMASLLLVGCLQVLLRNVFSTGLDWADVYLRHVVLVAGMLGATATTQAGRHLCIDALVRILPPGPQRLVGVVLSLASFLVCALLVTVSVTFVQQELQTSSEPLFWGLYRGHIVIIFPVAFGLMAYRFLLGMLQGIAGKAVTLGHGGH